MQAALAAIISWDVRGLPPALGPRVVSLLKKGDAQVLWHGLRYGGVHLGEGRGGGENSCCPLELGKEGGPRVWPVPLLAGLEISK